MRSGIALANELEATRFASWRQSIWEEEDMGEYLPSLIFLGQDIARFIL